MFPAWFLLFFFISENGADPSMKLLMSVTRSIKLIDDTTNKTSVIANAEHVIALDYHLARSEMYFTQANGRIYRGSLRSDGGIQGEPTIIAEVKLSDGVAVDWVNDNLYWTDVGRQTLEVATLDGLYRTVLLNETHGLEKPRAIVVDPSKGVLFLSDWGDHPRVESSGLDGKNNKTVISSNLLWPNGLTLDLTHSKLYVVDGMMSTITSCNYDGSDLKVLSRSTENLMQAFGITFYSNNLYWNSWRARTLFKMNINNERTETILQQRGLIGLFERMMGLKAMDASLQPKPSTQNPCKTANCSHRCLLSRYLTPTCICPFGFKLSPDGKTCKEEGYLLLSWRRTIRRYTVDGVNEERLIDSTTAAISLDYHLKKGLVFWSDIDEHRIYRAPIDQLNNKTVIATPETCDGLAVDWVHDVIYWTDNDRNTLEAAQLDGSKHMVIFNTDLDQPRDIALDPYAGYMFWTDWGATPKIERSTLDGLERKVIIEDNHIWPNGITIDIPNKKIYYVDGKIGRIYSSSYDGDKQIIFISLTTSLHLFGITVLKDELFWTDWESRTLFRSPKDEISTAKGIATSAAIPLRPNGIKAVHSSLQEPKENACAKVRCQNLCLGTKYNTAHCMGEEAPGTEVLDNPELVKKLFNDSIDITVANNVTLTSVLITVKCMERLGCREDFNCLNKSAGAFMFNNKNSFHITNLLPGSHYKIHFISEELIESFNITTEVTDSPEIPKITSVDKQGNKVIVKWDPVDTCIPGFSSYHFKLYKNGVESVAQEGSSNQTEVSFDNLEEDVSYDIHVYTVDSKHFSSKTFEVHKGVPAECENEKLQCDGKEDCPDGRDEDVKQCAAIENVIVYKKSRTDVFFRVEVTNGTKRQLSKFVGSYSRKLSDTTEPTEPFEKTAEPCVMWPESYCLHISSLQPNKIYDFKISAVETRGKVGSKYTISATTKEEASGPPENLQVFKHNSTCLMYQWQHPNQSNGIIKNFIINIDETETFESNLCCQAFSIIEVPASSEQPFYDTATTGLTPAASYAISIAAKNKYVGTSAVTTANTPPPQMKIIRMPRVDVASLLPLSWQPLEDPGEAPVYHDLIRSYMLLLLPPKNEPLETPIRKPDAVFELLQSRLGDRYVVLWNKNVEETAAFQSSIKVESLTARKQYKFAWIQVSQYMDSYNIDILESDPFIAV